ncbi:hypothetical protein QYF61_003745 [Mycteria americana]|uniref:Uncharacterized protein n=1 Tax=Mycteria americana TaxID=33587 RepID=A0AAN7NSK1_MYCAM|nr:hypothetical protein QYF61_003745 [Mycteria americana]
MPSPSPSSDRCPPANSPSFYTEHEAICISDGKEKKTFSFYFAERISILLSTKAVDSGKAKESRENSLGPWDLSWERENWLRPKFSPIQRLFNSDRDKIPVVRAEQAPAPPPLLTGRVLRVPACVGGLCRALSNSPTSFGPGEPKLDGLFRDGDSATSLGSLFQCLTTLSVKKNFLISNPNLPWHNLRPFPLVLSFVAVESDKVSPQPPFLQAKQPQFPQPLLIRLVLQTLHQLRCPSLDTLQHLNVSFVVRGPKLNTVFEVRPHRCRVQGHDHFPSPAGHTISDTSQDAIGFLGHLGTLLAHIQAAVNQYSQALFRRAAFQPLFPKPVALHGVIVTQVQDLALGLVEPHTVGLGPSIQPVQVPLQSLPTLKQINTPAQLGIICKLTEGALHPFVQIIDKDIKQDWPQHRALANTTCDRPPTGVNSIHHHSLGPAIQPVFYPVKSTPIQAMSSQFLQENAVGNHVKV